MTITQQQFILDPVPDIQNHPAQAEIESALKNRQMDTFADGNFYPDQNVTRGDFADHLYLNTPLRQSLAATPRYSDVSSGLRGIVEAVTANGSTLRDYNFAPAGMINIAGPLFKPQGQITRLDLAVALVRALGLDSEAKAKASTNVTVIYNGQTLTLTDNSDIPAGLRGYVQLALDKGILQAYFSLEQGPFDAQPILKARALPADPVTRAWLAYALDHYRQHFVAGN
jgi:serine protease AprX